MKVITTFIALLLIVRVAYADDITLTDGTVLKNARIVQRDDSTKTVTISFSGGITQVHSEMVPDTLATAQPPAVTNAVSQTTPVPQPPTPAPPSTPIPTDWTVDGRDYHNVKVTEVEPDRVHITYDGGLGTVLLKDMPPDLQKRFNYDPAQAKATAHQRDTDQNAAIHSYASVDQERAKLQAQQTAQAEQAQAAQAQAQSRVTYGMVGKVLQKIPGGGLLVSCEVLGAPSDGATASESVDNEDGTSTHIRDYTVLMLKGMPNEADLVDNSPIREVVYRSGNYNYTSTEGVTKTIAAYTAVRNIPTPDLYRKK